MENYLNEFIIIAIAHFIALISPGADFVYILNSALSNKPKVAIGASAGIALSNGFYIVLCLLGYATFISQNEIIVNMIKIIGGSYLLYLAFFILKSKPFHLELKLQKQSTFTKEFYRGFILSILNPKISIFYLSLFTLAISSNTPMLIQFLYGLWMVLVVFIWDSLLIFLLNNSRLKKRVIAIVNLQNLMAILLIAMGVGLFVTLL